MKLLSFIYFLSVFAVIDSACTRKTPRREGFVRHTCVPGFYEGSCLIILEKLPFHNARESCRYDYGGRLATAPTKEAIQIWRRTIHFDSKITVNEDTRFWVGYGMGSTATHGRDDFGFKYDEPDVEMRKFVDLGVWSRVFGYGRSSAPVHWERDADKDSLEVSNCPDYGVVFNPNNLKFDVKHSDEEYYALCEKPRWAKLQCDDGWHLIPQLRMCLKVHMTNVNFFSAHDTCRNEKSFISVSQNYDEIVMFRAVIVPYGLPPHSNKVRYNSTLSVPSYWTGLKSLDGITYSLDGTISVIGSESSENLCQTDSYEDFIVDGNIKPGMSVVCDKGYLPFLCQRFADQSLIKNL